MPLLIAVLLGLSGLFIVIYPLLGLDRESEDALSTAPIADVAERERSARDALREVEFDHRLGNLDEDDYQALRARYERRALAALKTRYQREQELDALIERRLDTLRQREASAARPAATPSQQAKAAPAAPKPSHNGRSANSSVRDRRAPRRKGS